MRYLLALGILIGMLAGCASRLGYVPHNLDPAALASPTKVPSYPEVVTWAYQVAEGYDSRVALNRHATRAGGVAAVTIGGVMGGMAIYGAGLAFLPALPLVGGFLGGVGAVYQNDQKAALYSRAAGRIVAAIDASALRVAQSGDASPYEAVCLKAAVGAVMRTVALHVTALTPDNVAQVLARVNKDTKIIDAFGVAPGDFRDLDVRAGEVLLPCDREVR